MDRGFCGVCRSSGGGSRRKPRQRGSAQIFQARETLTVGFLPVTCHLTCPVTDFATCTSAGPTRFESQLYTDFPTIVESFKAGRIQASFMIAPLAMKMREQGSLVKILYLGHRDGSTVIVRKDIPATDLRGLRGKSFAIPSKYSNQNLVIHKLMADQGVKPEEIQVSWSCRRRICPDALAAKALDAYFVGEPHAAKAELDGSGRVLYWCEGHLAALHLVRPDCARES